MDYDTNLIMQKALSLYLDNGMFDKNLTYLSKVFQEQENKSTEPLARFPNILHFSSSLQHLVIELPQNKHLGELKFTKQVDYLENNYLTQAPKRFIKLPNNQHLPKTLKMILN